MFWGLGEARRNFETRLITPKMKEQLIFMTNYDPNGFLSCPFLKRASFCDKTIFVEYRNLDGLGWGIGSVQD